MEELHFVLFPFMAQGHMIPMVDIAKILSQSGVVVTLITTPHNAGRFKRALAGTTGLKINLIKLQVPFKDAGVPEGCENLDMIFTADVSLKFFRMVNSLGEQVGELFHQLTPPPTCIISDYQLYYTAEIATKFGVPRIGFQGFSCFASLCLRNLHVYEAALEKMNDSDDVVEIPGLPWKIEFRRSQLPAVFTGEWKEMTDAMAEADEQSYGTILNSCYELELPYVEELKKLRRGNVWCVGPVSLTLHSEADKVERGHDDENRSAIDHTQLSRWLDSQATRSVVFACLGSLCNLTKAQLIELGLALEATNRPFLWVIRGGEKSKGLEEWISVENFEQRNKDRGCLVRGWAPQLLILSHPSIGGFLTHCGWNSTLEGICSGLPLVTWPLFGDQFFNERLVTEVLKIGVKIGVNDPNTWGEEEAVGVVVRMADVVTALEKLMDEGKEAHERRERARMYGEMVQRAVEGEGSSHTNMTSLIRCILELP